MTGGTETGEGHGNRSTDAEGRCATQDVAAIAAPTEGINEQLTSTRILDHRDLQSELRMSFRTQPNCCCNVVIIAGIIHHCQYRRAFVLFAPVRIAQAKPAGFGVFTRRPVMNSGVFDQKFQSVTSNWAPVPIAQRPGMHRLHVRPPNPRGIREEMAH
jgi:hypothetical protein